MTALFGVFKRSYHQRTTSRSISRFLILGFICLGIALRLFHLDHKIYWGDEVATSLRISGHTFQDSTAQLLQQNIFNVADLQTYQYPDIGNTSALDTVRSLIQEDAQHPPLYFLLARAWVSTLGPSIANIRGLSVLFSILTLPAIYWLCQELFRKSIVGEIAIILAAISPMHVIYAQEARQYSLWLFLIVLSSATLVRATRLRQPRWLLVYGFTVLLGLYTHAFFGTILLGQALYVLVSEKYRLSYFFKAFLGIFGVSILSFVPWLVVLINHPTHQLLELKPGLEAALNAPTPDLPNLLLRWFGILTRTFIDVGISPFELSQLSGPFVGLVGTMAAALIGLSGYGLYHLSRYPIKAPLYFLGCLMGTVTLPLIWIYLFWGQQLFVTRYILPLALLLQLLMAFVLAKKLTLTENLLHRKIWQWVVTFVISCGIFSCVIRIPVPIWWNQVPAITGDLPQIAQVINQSEQPLVISNGTETLTIPILYTLGHLVAPKTHFQLLAGPNTELSRENFKTIFLIDPSRSLLPEVETTYEAKAMPIGKWAWQLKP